MDVVVPSICLSSVAGAILFYAGGRLQARPSPPAPTAPEAELERAARLRAEEEMAGALRATRDAVAALAEERSRTTALREALAAEQDARARADAEVEAARVEAGRARAEAAQARAEAAQARAETERATAAARRLSTEAATLRARAAEIEAARGREGEAQARASATEARASAAEARASAAETRAARSEARATKAEATAAEALAKAASAEGLREENRRLEGAVSALEQQRAAMPDLAEVQRRALSATMALRTLEQRSEEVARREAENADLRRRVEALSGAAAEAEVLRRRVRELEALGFAEATHGWPRSDEDEDGPTSESLEASLSVGLREVCQGEEGCRAAVLSDMRGLLIAAFGEEGHRLELAAAAALTTTTAERLRELLPLGEPLAFTLADANAIRFSTRWLRWEDDCFLLSTLGAAPSGADATAEAIRGRLAALLGRSATPSPGER